MKPKMLNGPLIVWGGVMLALWTVFPLLLFTDTLWRSESFMHTLLPGLYDWARSTLPQEWREASVEDAPVRAVTLALYFMVVGGLWLAYIMAVRATNKKSEIRNEKSEHGDSALSTQHLRLTGDQTPATNHRTFIIVLLGAVAFSIPTLLWPAMFSDDVFAYAAQGKMQVVYGLNPLVDPPARMGNDPLVNLSPWREIPTTYGPAWLGVTKGVAAIVQPLGGRPVGYLLAFKLLNVGLLLAGTALVWAIGGKLGWGVDRRAAACILFGWCPLITFDLVGSAHNDALLVFFILVAIWLHLRGWWPLAIGALVLGGLVKLSGFFLLPAYFVFLLRSSGQPIEAARRVAIGGGVAVGVGVMAYLPYAHPGLLNGLLSNPLAGSFGPSVGLSVRQGLVDLGMALRGRGTPLDWTAEGIIEAVQWPIWNGALILWAVVAVVISLTARDFGSLIRAWTLVFFAYLVIGSVWFMPWYITWLVPMIALLPAGHLRRALILFAWGGTLFYALTPSLPWDQTPNLRNYYVPGIIFLPPLLYLAWVGIVGWMRRSRAISVQKPSEAL